MLRRPHRAIRSPGVPRWALALALAALLAGTLSVPDFAREARADTTVTSTSAATGLPPGETPPPTGDEEPSDERQPSDDQQPANSEQPGDSERRADGKSAAASAPDSAATAYPSEGIATTEPAPSTGQILVSVPWGDGPGEVGLVRPAEGLARGPEALAVAPDGRIVILDSVNRRIVVLAPDGRYVGHWPLGLNEPRFLAVSIEGVFVLDSDRDRQLVQLDWNGAEVARLSIPPLVDAVTALLVTDRGPCIETGHNRVFLVDLGKSPVKSMGAGEVAAVLQEVSGRPLTRALDRTFKATYRPAAGLTLKCFRLDRKTLKSTLVGSATPSLAAGSLGNASVEHLISVDTVGDDQLLVGARLGTSADAQPGRAALLIAKLRLTAEGRAIPTATTPLYLDDRSLAYVGLPYVVAPDGRVFQPRATETGYLILVHEFPNAAAGVSSVMSTEEVIP